MCDQAYDEAAALTLRQAGELRSGYLNGPQTADLERYFYSRPADNGQLRELCDSVLL